MRLFKTKYLSLFLRDFIMNYIHTKRKIFLLTLLFIFTFSVSADDKYEQLVNEVETLKKQLQQMQSTLKQYQEDSVSKKEVQELKQDIESSVISEERADELEKQVAQSGEWSSPSTLIHMAGYANV